MDKLESISVLIALWFAFWCFFRSGKYYDDKEYARACFRLMWGMYIMIICAIHYK